ncbi:MAG: hypothetical protein H8E66_06250 [Planctomycetes bacterium]|nr:hypothetical protein [Planctomycetota bacterium]
MNERAFAIIIRRSSLTLIDSPIAYVTKGFQTVCDQSHDPKRAAFTLLFGASRYIKQG